MKIDRFLVREGQKVNLKNHPTDFTGDYTDKETAGRELADNVKRIAELQEIMYAQDEQALLLVFQAMDAAGKDSAIEHVLTGLNPQGCSVVSFKQPSAEDLDHDYLWRCAKRTPERGKIGVFNRSHYEDVLVVRVHRDLLEAQRLPAAVKNSRNIWKTRYRQIRDWETHLVENGTQIIKFFLNVSKDEQKKRFLDRIEQPDKNWKFSAGDLQERELWAEYMQAYADALSATSTAQAPWYIIPADKKWFTRLAVSYIIRRRMESMKLKYPALSESQKKELADARKIFAAER